MSDSKKLVSFSLLDGLYWAFYAAFAGYIATYLLDCGMSNSFLSIVLAAFMACSFIGAFYWGGRCDKKQSNKKVFMPEFTAAAVTAVVIFFTARISLWIPTILYPLFGFLAAPLGSNLDSWMLRSFHNDASTYGRARAIGSAGYAVTALIIGTLINRLGFIVMPIGIAVCGIPVILIAMFMKEESYGSSSRHVEPQNPLNLLKIRPYMYMIVILFLTGLASSPVNNLKIVILQTVGGDVGILGIDSFIGVMIQALLIGMAGQMRRLKPYLRLFIMSAAVVLDLFLIYTASNWIMVILGSAAWNMSYGFMLPTMREITEETVTGPLKNTAHAMSDAMYGAFAGIIALLYSGSLMDAFGAKSVALLGLFIMIIPVAMTFVKMLKKQ